jgi:hypothetical protein
MSVSVPCRKKMRKCLYSANLAGQTSMPRSLQVQNTGGNVFATHGIGYFHPGKIVVVRRA